MTMSLIQDAIANLAVQGVFLRTATIWQRDDFDIRLTDIDLLVQTRAGTTVLNQIELKDEDTGEISHLFKAQFACGLRLADPSLVTGDDPSTGLVIDIQATFVAEYAIKSGAEISREALDAFSKANVGYHVWPYWREYVQSTCSRLSLPVIAIPMYTVPKSNQAQPAKAPPKRRKKTEA
jgi:hypothetical protein